MDISKYLETMKNLPDRFSNLAFWRGVRKLRDGVVNAFEYVDSWGKDVESQLDNIPYHNEYPYQFLKDDSTRIFKPFPIRIDVKDHIRHNNINNNDVPDTYVFQIVNETPMTFTSSHYFKPENLYIRGIHIDVTLASPDSPNYIYKRWSVITTAAIQDYIINSEGRISGFKIKPLVNVFTLTGIDNDIASGNIMRVQLSFDAYGVAKAI